MGEFRFGFPMAPMALTVLLALAAAGCRGTPEPVVRTETPPAKTTPPAETPAPAKRPAPAERAAGSGNGDRA